MRRREGTREDGGDDVIRRALDDAVAADLDLARSLEPRARKRIAADLRRPLREQRLAGAANGTEVGLYECGDRLVRDVALAMIGRGAGRRHRAARCEQIVDALRDEVLVEPVERLRERRCVERAEPA